MKIFLVKLVLIFLISLPVAILCKRWDSSIKPFVLVIFAISVLCVKFLIDVLEKKIFHPKVIVSAEKKEKEAPALLNSVYALIDKGVKKGIFHINKASRQKAKLSKKIAS